MTNWLHDKVFEFLEDYRASHPGFVYWLRERNTKNRLTDGFWFQGNEDYVFVGLYDHSGGSNKTRSIGLYFFPAPNDSVTCSLEVVYNEERDQQVLKLYEEIKKLSGNFKRIADTRYREDFPGNGFASAENFLKNTKPAIDTLIKKLQLDHFFIDQTDFDQKLLNIHTLRNKSTSNLFPPEKIEQLKRKYEEFKKDDFFKERIRQLKFIPFAQKIITNSLKGDLTNETFTGLIQILKNGAKSDTVNYYINKNITGLNLRSELKRQFSEFGFTGYTGAGKTGINGLNDEQLEAVKKLVLDCSVIKTKEEAGNRVKEFDALNIPQIKCGVYSPWLYYMNPTVFPIKNNSHDGFIKWCGQPTGSYPLAISLFHEVSDILGEKDLGLIDAFTHMFSEEEDDEEAKINFVIKETNTMSLNTILYGPPGTGKTYHTINKSVAIANPDFDIGNSSREKLKAEYERLVKEGQIEFVTFHQSMSYEDFIEGIKPVEPKEDDGFLKYEIKDGIFKRLCEKASKVPDMKPTGFSISEDEFQKASFYKISLGDTSNPDDDQIYEWCINNGSIALGWGDAIDFTGKAEIEIQQMAPAEIKPFAATAINSFIHYLKPGNFVIVSYGNHAFRAIGRVTGNYEYKNVDGLNVHQFRKVEWLLKDVELPYEEVYDRQFSQQSIYRMDKKGIKKDFFVKTSKAIPSDNKNKNYVLIIDEINRGNVSQIFGELITLIEDDKRAGREEGLSVTLPYSKKSFSVPSNLYLIGTMNTADRSVEALDTALRRRFAFELMSCKPELLSSYRLLQQLWYKHWLAEPGTKEWDNWEADEDKFKELTGLSYEQAKYKALADKYEKKGMEVTWLNTDPEQLFSGIVRFDNGIDLFKLLTTINNRLEVLLSRDQTIGHAWLMNVYNLTDLQAAFKNKILPLLQEFFYNDYAKIGLVLGNAFVLQHKAERNIFARFKDESELATEYEDKIIYTLVDPYKLELKDFIAIYQ